MEWVKEEAEGQYAGPVESSPAHGALVARMPGLIALRGGAGQRGVAVHAERVVVLVALLASPAGAAAEEISVFCRARAKVCNEKCVCVSEREQ